MSDVAQNAHCAAADFISRNDKRLSAQRRSYIDFVRELHCPSLVRSPSTMGEKVARSEETNAGKPAAAERVVSLLEEEARVEKRTVTTGRVRVRTVSEAIEDIATATLDDDEVEVVRMPKDVVITEAPAIRTEAGVTIVPIVEEVMVVTKQLVLREELHIHRRTKRETVQVPITLRKQRAVVERLDGTDTIRNEEQDT